MADETPPPSAPSPTREQPGRKQRREGEGFPVGIVLFTVLAVYGIVFILVNSDQVDVNFVFFSTSVSLVVALLLAIVVGFLAGYLFRDLRSRRRARPSRTA